MSKQTDLLNLTDAIDSSADATAITIDSSENVLVGKATTAFGTAGANITSAGSAEFTRDSVVMNLNRLSTDGDIQRFYKDGSTVGTIGVIDGNNTFLQGATGHGGIAFVTNNVVPFREDAYRDNTLDLGQGDVRWKDLYLSGGVYLGGTGSANKLDDYEEGTWTPNLAGSTGGNFTMGTQQGFYTKVGSVVTVYYNVQYSSTASAGGNVRLYGFPFTAKNNSGAFYYTGSTINTNGQISVAMAGNGNQAIFLTSTSGAGTVSQFNSSGDDRANGSFSYLTDA